MKSKRQAVPQFEFGFSGDSFALVGERSAPAKTDTPAILAEMTDTERERVREQSRAAFASELVREVDAVPSEITQPGLAAGSAWHNWTPEKQAMAKAIATGGGR